ncbi:hypothetical protein D9M68_649260 [compost metagenome]
MEEGIDDQVAVPGVHARDRGPAIDGAQVLRVRGHHALGASGGARGEHDVHRRVAAHAGLALRERRHVRLLRQRKEAIPRQLAVGQRPALPRPQDHQPLQRGGLVRCQHLRIAFAEEVVDAEQQARTAVGQHGAGFGALHARIERHQRGAHAVRGQRRDDPFGEVRRPYRNAVARLHAERHQRAARLDPAGVQRGVAQAQPVFLDGDALAVA